MSVDPIPAGAGAPLEPEARRGLEAILFLADEPVGVATLADVVEGTPEAVEQALRQLADTYLADGRGMEIHQVAGGWRMYTSPAARPAVERWALAGRTGRLTQAALETLAVVAYKQPIGRQEIGDIRGVNADGAVRSLVARGLVEEVGRDDRPGQAALFGTTPLLLERLGLDSLDELPPLTDYLPEAPAPDEPELGALKEIRRRLAAGGDLATGALAGRSDRETNTGSDDDERAEDDEQDTLPPPTARVGARRTDDDMEDLTQRLEDAARHAVDRLRASVEANTRADTESSLDDDEAAGEAPADRGTASDETATGDVPADRDTAADETATGDETPAVDDGGERG